MSETTTVERSKALLQTVSEKFKILYQRAYRALTFDRSVYNEVKDDPEATIPSALVPFLIEIAFLVIVGIAAIPLWLLYGATWQPVSPTLAQWAAGIGIAISASIVFFLGTFLCWVAALFVIGRFAGIKELQIKQVLRVCGLTFVPLFLSPFVFVATMYTAVANAGIAAAIIFLVGGLVIFILLAINNILAMREITGMTTGVSIMSNTFAVVLFGILSTLMYVAYGLSLAGLFGAF